jgi:hypothetical protein
LLIDVKTTATLRIRTEDWRQLIGYAALNAHFPIGGGAGPVLIRRVGFYFSRHGYLVSWPLTELVDQAKFTAFAAWLRDYATAAHAQRLARRAKVAQERAAWRERQERRRGARARPKGKAQQATNAPRRARVKPKKKPPTGGQADACHPAIPSEAVADSARGGGHAKNCEIFPGAR